MKDSKKALDRDESDDCDSVETVSPELRVQVAAGECIAIRGELYRASTSLTRIVGRGGEGGGVHPRGVCGGRGGGTIATFA